MEVKEVTNSVEKVPGSSAVSRPNSETRSSLSALSAGSVSKLAGDATRVNIRENPSTLKSNDLRKQVNEVLSRANVASQVADQLGGLVRGIGGIVEQANTPDISAQRKVKLEQEGNDLLGEVERVIKIVPKEIKSDKNTPVSDEVRSDVEQQLRQALDALFPEKDNGRLGINKIDLSTKETIIDTIAQVERAQRQIENITESVKKATDGIRLSANFMEVAMQNTEAAESSVRDVDSALKLAHDMKHEIDKNPEAALSSVGEFADRAIHLLKP